MDIHITNNLSISNKNGLQYLEDRVKITINSKSEIVKTDELIKYLKLLEISNKKDGNDDIAE